MNYYIDTEFLEGTQKTWLGGKTKPTIDLISIGIVAEDGLEYYAISKEFNLKEAWNRYDLKSVKYVDNGALEAHIDRVEEREYWIRENVLEPIYKELLKKENNSNVKGNYMFGFNLPIIKYDFNYKNFKKLLSKYGKTNKQIAEEVIKFIALSSCNCDRNENDFKICKKHNIEFYGYYSDYDWVVFCWLFGKMNNLPAGFPMYCIDLKQELDRIEKEYNSKSSELIFKTKELLNYPKQTNEHNALADAKWNKELHKFLNEL